MICYSCRPFCGLGPADGCLPNIPKSNTHKTIDNQKNKTKHVTRKQQKQNDESGLDFPNDNDDPNSVVYKQDNRLGFSITTLAMHVVSCGDDILKRESFSPNNRLCVLSLCWIAVSADIRQQRCIIILLLFRKKRVFHF